MRHHAASAAVALGLLLFVTPLRAQVKGQDADGRAVLLFPDGTWTYADQLGLSRQPQVISQVGTHAQYAGTKRRPSLRLRLLHKERNAITDDAQWLQSKGLALPLCKPRGSRGRGTCPARIPPSYRGGPLRRAIKGDGGYLLLYSGRTRYRAVRYVAVVDRDVSRLEYLLDLQGLMAPRGLRASDETLQEVTWAQREGTTLFVATAYNGYAKLARGNNAYLNAIDLPSGKLLWRSRPLVCNATNFVIAGDALVCGYGFTAEPDFLYLLDKHSGHTLSRQKVASGPSYIFLRGEDLHVRTYDHNYLFRLDGLTARR